LLDGIRDREVIDAMLAEVAGKEIAEANSKETGKIKRQIIRDCLDGANGRAKIEGWVPRWLRFPASSYTTRGGVASVNRTVSAAEAMTPVVAAEHHAESDVAPMMQAA
jgi:ParB family chromosome partitioning protein